MNTCQLLSLLCLLLHAADSAAASCRIENDAKVTPLLELYTSEGCSSCPPADRWLSHLSSTNKQVNAQVNALAFHVDYWDGLGWKDRFAQAAFSQKQRMQAARNGSRLVYTPQFTLNGLDFRAWNDASLQTAIAQINTQPAKVQLALQQGSDAGGHAVWQVSVLTRHAPASAQLWLAYYRHGLRSQVQAGENRGERLLHDGVVLQLTGPYALDDTAALQKLVPDPAVAQQASGVVAYVQDSRSGLVLQSLALPVCHE